jgi:asparagine synthase (glutamine-hydrolysing)
VIVFNGEIYNHLDLRRELEKTGEVSTWRGYSDTETLLAAVESWGVERAVRESVGMFAFGLWDRETRSLTLARDRIGEKPLYYGLVNGTVIFGSELKALHRWPEFAADIDRDALAMFLWRGYVPGTHSIYRGIKKLAPGCLVNLRSKDLQRGTLSPPVAYWSMLRAVENGMRNPFRGSDSEAAEELESLLRQSVVGQMVSDVPLGAFLSGGIDSSTVVALMQAQSPRPVKTFTIGFYEKSYNEAPYSKIVARYLGTDHTELYVTPEEAREVIPRLPILYDEPFSDSSQIPTFLISQLARRHVTVSLSGDGGDELFGGYNRHFWGRRLWKGLGWMPRGLRRMAARAIHLVSPEGWDRTLGSIEPLFPRKIRQQAWGAHVHKLAEILAVDSPDAMYRSLVSHWDNPATVVVDAVEPAIPLEAMESALLPDFTQRMMYLDAVTYLPDDILVKVDRASMGESLEARVPFLDHRVVEFAWRLPLSLKIRHGQGKWIVRQILHKYVPREIVERPKTGFGIPLDRWLRGPLKGWAEDLLSEKQLKEDGFFDPGPIRVKWAQHLSGRRNWQDHLWDVLMFQAWKERWC